MLIEKPNTAIFFFIISLFPIPISKLLYSKFIIFQVERQFWIRSLRISIYEPKWGDISSSNLIRYESKSFRVPDDGVVYFEYLGKVLKVQRALGSVNLNGLVPGKNKLID